MFSILEFNKLDNTFLRNEFFSNFKDAVRMCKIIVERCKDVKIIITELKYSEEGLLFEIVVWNSERQEDYNV